MINWLIKRYGTKLTGKNGLVTFQMEQNGTFLDNSKYGYWIAYEKNSLILIFHYFLNLLISSLK